MRASPTLLVLPYQLLEALLEGGMLDRLGGHDRRVLSVVRVVALPYAPFDEPVLAVEALCGMVRYPHLQSYDGCISDRSLLNSADQQKLADTLTPVLALDADGDDVGLSGHVPGAYETRQGLRRLPRPVSAE